MPTVAACGVLAATLAAILHEAVGHGIGCLADGGSISLLTSIWFRCRGGFTLTDLGGPFASLLGGAAGLLVLRLARIGTAARSSGLLFTAFSLFWFFGQLVFHAATDADDWAIVAHRHQWPWWWRPLAMAAGIAGYWASMRLMVGGVRAALPLGPRAILLGYLAGALSTGIAGLAWTPLPVRSGIEGLLTLGLAPIGLLAVARRATPEPATRVSRSSAAMVAGVLLYAGFVLTMGRGIGELAGLGLTRASRTSPSISHASAPCARRWALRQSAGGMLD